MKQGILLTIIIAVTGLLIVRAAASTATSCTYAASCCSELDERARLERLSSVINSVASYCDTAKYARHYSIDEVISSTYW